MKQSLTTKQEKNFASGKYHGAAILGNKNTCVVISAVPGYGVEGIKHFYYRTYKQDYVNCGYPVIRTTGRNESISQTQSESGLMYGFCAYSECILMKSKTEHICRNFVTEKGAFVNSGVISNGSLKHEKIILAPHIELTGDILSLNYLEEHDAVIAEGCNDTFIIIAMKERQDAKGKSSSFAGKREKWPKELERILQREKNISPKSRAEIEYYLIPADNIENGLDILKELRTEQDTFSITLSYWKNWLDSGIRPEFSTKQAQSYYEANLISIKAVNLNGAIPADLTGQFVSEKSSLFAPRDSMMTARAFLLAEHIEEAVQILNYWNQVSLNQDGFFYAWYADIGRVESKGTGATYDTPEYDSNGYYTTLMSELFERTGKWYGNYEKMSALLDFLCAHQTEEGILEPEGGVIEEVGKLPGTNMNCSAALKDGAVICALCGENKKSEKYYNAGRRMEKGVSVLYDEKENYFFDIRHPYKIERHCLTGQAKIWNTSMLIGILWGFPDSNEIQSTNKWYLKNCEKLGGGIQYSRNRFLNGSLFNYLEDLFLIFTGSSAQYQALYGKSEDYQRQINWMMNHSNIYGLMPERILMPDGKKACQASPLSWASAEFISALLIGCFCAEPYMVKTFPSDNLKFVKTQIQAIKYYLREIHKKHTSPGSEVMEKLIGNLLEKTMLEKATKKLYLQLKEEIAEANTAISSLELSGILKERLKKKTSDALFFLDKGIKFFQSNK